MKNPTLINQPSALTGLKVIDLTRVLGGPYCTQILADHGAEVLKIEPPTGDETRMWGPPFVGDTASYFLGVNRNKKGLSLDLKQDNARAFLRILLQDADVLIVDTAGRLHNKKYLMDELNKIQKVINKEMQEADKEVLLVIDGTTGQNAISQVKAFKEEADLTGLVITKLDGTAKGGVAIGIVEENKIPIKFIGVGEQIDDMEIFNSEDFVKAII